MKIVGSKEVFLYTVILALFGLAACAGTETDLCRAPNLSHKEMTKCADGELRKAMVNLDDIYKKLIKRSGPETQIKLRAAQETWIAYRDRECEFEAMEKIGDKTDGFPYSLKTTECRTSITLQHANHLRSELACDEGNASCAQP